jgi:hypothetical protein
VDDLTEDEIEAVLNTRGFRKMLAYQRLAEGIQVLADEDLEDLYVEEDETGGANA